MKKDSFAIVTYSASKNNPNNILIYDRNTDQVTNILNPNPAPEFLGLRLFPNTEENPLLLVRDRQHVSVVDVTNFTLVNLFSSPIYDDLMSAFYMDVRQENGNYEIFAIE